MDGTPTERWQQLDRLVDAALELPAAERAAFVERAAGGDAGLRQEAERLLRACEDAEHFLEVPAPNFAARLLTDSGPGADAGGDRAVGPAPAGPTTDLRARLQAALRGIYDIEREIGAGGMATVYLAGDRKHDRLVAMKVLRAELASAASERFLREIRVV